MNLEDLREEDIGETFAWFPAEGQDDSKLLMLSFPRYSNRAFYYSCQTLEQLEKSKNQINQGNNCIDAIGLWFVSIESFINSLLKISCRLKCIDFVNFKKDDIGKRLSMLIEHLQLDKVRFYKCGVLQQFEEFKTFRNEIFHDRFHNSKIEFNRTEFSPIPFLSNQVDVMQASLIALNVFNCFRYVYSGLDLMPSLCIQKDDSYGFLKYDYLYNNLMRPLFTQSLEKHNLTTVLDLEPTMFSYNESEVVKPGEVKFTIRAFPSVNQPKANNSDTDISGRLMQKARREIKIDTTKNFQLPNYKR